MEERMKRVFDMVAIASGMLGLAAIVVNSAPLTAENASVHVARALIVMTFVVVPYLIARTLEKVDFETLKNRLLHFWSKYRKQSSGTQDASAPTPFFDYFFQPDSGQEWQSAPLTSMPARKLPGRQAPRGQENP
jgi:hypothetical protein